MALTDKLTAIADAIRSKTGKSELMTLDQMATEIDSLGGGDGVAYIDIVNNTGIDVFVGTAIVANTQNVRVYDAGIINAGFLPLFWLERDVIGKKIGFTRNGVSNMLFTIIGEGGTIATSTYPSAMLMLYCSDGTMVAMGETIELTLI